MSPFFAHCTARRPSQAVDCELGEATSQNWSHEFEQRHKWKLRV